VEDNKYGSNTQQDASGTVTYNMFISSRQACRNT